MSTNYFWLCIIIIGFVMLFCLFPIIDSRYNTPVNTFPEHINTEEAINILGKNFCSTVEIAGYQCYRETSIGKYVDACLVQEINYLNAIGIQTIGCCCGHAKFEGYIQVNPGDVARMIELGYKWNLPDKHGNGPWCFKPKSILPVPIESKENNQ